VAGNTTTVTGSETTIEATGGQLTARGNPIHLNPP
jgi:hypothetical protein